MVDRWMQRPRESWAELMAAAPTDLEAGQP
jgi:hypothetical protein